jgi:acyl-CoA dehydrogenase
MSAVFNSAEPLPPEKPSAASAPGTQAGRAALLAWERAQPGNFYDSDTNLQRVLEFYWGAQKLAAHAAEFSRFGHELARVVDPAVRRANLNENLPRLDRFSAAGERTENVAYSADHDTAGRAIYGSGVIACYAAPQSNLHALALHYLSSYNGEAGHNCPVACTAGVVKVLQRHGSDELKAEYLPRLLERDYGRRLHGAQFLTEIQGGSDVGANACAATPLDPARGTWLINGEKWFCSNVTADLALVTARPAGAPPGTKGLGLFLVPRHLDDGAVNGMYVRRLKDKLGTRSMATGEVDFRDALAYEIGGAGAGFQIVMDLVVNTSRLYNALGSAGAARRACVTARTYARHREAFGTPISRFPLVQEALAEMRAETLAMTAGSFHLAHLRDELEAGVADERAAAFFRLAVNLNKYRSSLTATDVVRRGIELLGGNGAVETFSVLPRLLRDAVIYEAWEGAHNTLLAQALRDIGRYRVHEAFAARLEAMFASLARSDGAPTRDAGLRQVAALRRELDRLLAADELSASVAFREVADRLARLFYAACLAREAEWEEREKQDAGKGAAARFFWQRHIEPQADKLSPDYLKLITEVSAAC